MPVVLTRCGRIRRRPRSWRPPTGRSQHVDGVLAVGGGSSMDVAKVVAVLLGGQQALAQLYGVGNVTGRRLPLVLVPTTAGTGSEVTPVAVITTGETTKAGGLRRYCCRIWPC